MSTTAVEQILRIVSVLHPHGPQYPGKPPAFRPEVPLSRRRLVPVVSEDGQVIAYGRAQCGATQSQTRAVKLGGWTQFDTAGQIGMAHLEDELRWMLEWIAGDDWRLPLLQLNLAATLQAQATFDGWKLKAGESDKIATLALHMLIDADACAACNTTGIGLDEQGRQGVCKECRGVGHVSLSDVQCAKLLQVPRETYRRRLAHVVRWAHALLQGQVFTILARINPPADGPR